MSSLQKHPDSRKRTSSGFAKPLGIASICALLAMPFAGSLAPAFFLAGAGLALCSIVARPSWLGVLPLCLCALLFLLSPVSNSNSTYPEGKAMQNLSSISSGLMEYMKDHQGSMPPKLSDLVPDYIAASELALFFPPLNRELRRLAKSSPAVQLASLDSRSAFLAFPNTKGSNILICVRPEIWKDPEFHTDFHDGLKAIVLCGDVMMMQLRTIPTNELLSYISAMEASSPVAQP